VSPQHTKTQQEAENPKRFPHHRSSHVGWIPLITKITRGNAEVACPPSGITFSDNSLVKFSSDRKHFLMFV
jgi:hypothetical protein